MITIFDIVFHLSFLNKKALYKVDLFVKGVTHVQYSLRVLMSDKSSVIGQPKHRL